ncbi:MAG: RNA polymerase sigma-54 factor, partial [Planctomycetes bacterium]|nr:RNA polymerase sigma-54 factor [Planctomycetota bacterium]
MKLELAQNLRQELQLRMSPQLIQRIEILQLAAMDLRELIEKEIMENEVLELSEPLEESFPEKEKESVADAGEPAEDGESVENFTLDAELERLRNLTEWSRETRQGSGRRSGDDEDPKMLAMQNTASRSVTLQEHLQNQLGLAECDDEIRSLAEQIIFNINPRGYLLYPLEEINIPLEGEHTFHQLEAALNLVQSFDPKGVGARNLPECLLLQLDPKHPRFHLMRKIVLNHLEDISRNRLPKVIKETGETLESIQECIALLGRLDPIPGRGFTSEEVPYIHPDVVLELIDGEYEILLEDSYYPKLGISESYLKILGDRSVDPKLRKHLRQKIESAKWLIESIEQRKSTLRRVVQELIQCQREALDHGIKHLKPLKMQEVADRLGIHVSTVSRT